MLFLAGQLVGEDVAVDVRVDGGEDQALEFVGGEGFDFPRVAGSPEHSAWIDSWARHVDAIS
ncbi:hypothetical protein GCM10010372_82640 [Streptomyces tauricus]|uniref:hypothetical protein n=1 Tax=Streptomyces tauricus TaxID=68274 RepID=UPI0016791470|nr:hypothetical protein [Streptomyces tauricus]GHA71083.1 hypothetical protein GCM10010372_82640 [Streptomyces tauricus]